jgi:hypothetical protein
MKMFKPGDHVRLKSGEFYTGVTRGKIYTVISVSGGVGGSGELVSFEFDDGVRRGLYARRLELVPNEKTITITGSIVNRGDGVVTVMTEHGSVVIPEALAPLDPRMVLLRKIAKTAVMPNGSRSRRVDEGEFDSELAEFLEDINA